MTTLELMQRVIENHNRVAQVVVSGDNAILIGDTLRDLRQIVNELQEQSQREQNELELRRTDKDMEVRA